MCFPALEAHQHLIPRSDHRRKSQIVAIRGQCVNLLGRQERSDWQEKRFHMDCGSPAAVSVSRSPNKPLRYHRRGSVMARHHLGRFDGQQAGLPKHGLRQPAAALPRQPAAASVSRSPNKPLRCRRRGSVMARHHLGRFDGQQAGLPKAAAGCRSPCVEGKRTARDQ